jgi:hypothetical protein
MVLLHSMGCPLQCPAKASGGLAATHGDAPDDQVAGHPDPLPDAACRFP